MTLGGEVASDGRPAGRSVEGHAVLVGRCRLQALDHHDRVVMSFDGERPTATAEHLDLARGVCLHPDGGLGFSDIAKNGSQYKFGHRCGGYSEVRTKRAPRRLLLSFCAISAASAVRTTSTSSASAPSSVTP